MGEPRIPHLFYFLFEEFAGGLILAELLELVQVEDTSFLLVDLVKEYLDVFEVELDSVVLEHLLQFFSVQSAGAVVIKLEKDVFDVVLSLQLRFGLHVKVLGCVLVPRQEPVLRLLRAHLIAYVAGGQRQSRLEGKGLGNSTYSAFFMLLNVLRRASTDFSFPMISSTLLMAAALKKSVSLSSSAASLSSFNLSCLTSKRGYSSDCERELRGVRIDLIGLRRPEGILFSTLSPYGFSSIFFNSLRSLAACLLII